MNDQRSTTDQLRDALSRFCRWVERTVTDMIDGLHKGMGRIW